MQEGGRAVGKVCSGEHAAIADVLCCRAARIRTPPRPQRLWASSLLVPATQHGAGCGVQGCEGVGSRGRWSRVRWSRERTPSPLLRISVRNVRGGAWPWLSGQRTREIQFPVKPECSKLSGLTIVGHPRGCGCRHSSASAWPPRLGLPRVLGRSIRTTYGGEPGLQVLHFYFPPLTPGTSFFQRFWRQGGSLAYWEERGGLKRGSRAS